MITTEKFFTEKEESIKGGLWQFKHMKTIKLFCKFSCFAERGGFSLKSIKKGSSQGGGFSAMGPAADVWYSPVLSVAS